MPRLIKWLDGETSNPLMRAWQVSSYTGAANGDPFLLQEICSQAPRSLSGKGNHHIRASEYHLLAFGRD